MNQDDKLPRPVSTPGVHSRGEAWMAWEASMLSSYRDKRKYPKSNFQKRWERLKGHLYQFEEIKRYTGFVTAKTLGGETKTLNILERKESYWNSSTFFDNGFIFNDEHKELQTIQQWLWDLHRVFRKEYIQLPCPYTMRNLMLLKRFPHLRKADLVKFTPPRGYRQFRVTEFWTEDGVVRDKVFTGSVVLFKYGESFANSFTAIYNMINTTKHLDTDQ